MYTFFFFLIAQAPVLLRAGGGGRETEGESRNQESKSRKLNGLSHPGAPGVYIL